MVAITGNLVADLAAVIDNSTLLAVSNDLAAVSENGMKLST
jgi:hypothetical protein